MRIECSFQKFVYILLFNIIISDILMLISIIINASCAGFIMVVIKAKLCHIEWPTVSTVFVIFHICSPNSLSVASILSISLCFNENSSLARIIDWASLDCLSDNLLPFSSFRYLEIWVHLSLFCCTFNRVATQIQNQNSRRFWQLFPGEITTKYS